MALCVVQFVHPSRPAVDYSDMPRIRRARIPADGGPNNYLRIIRSSWLVWARPRGLVVLEQDIAIDPRHLDEIEAAIVVNPNQVYAVPYPLWPKSTGALTPQWAHATSGDLGQRRALDIENYTRLYIDWFGLGCTYLPPTLLEAAPDTEQSWDYPVLDTRFSELSQRLGLPCYLTQTPAVHLHW